MSVSHQGIAVLFHPAFAVFVVEGEFFAQVPEVAAMVHVDEVGDFVGDDIIGGSVGSEDQAPGEGHVAVLRAASPSAFCIADFD